MQKTSAPWLRIPCLPTLKQFPPVWQLLEPILLFFVAHRRSGPPVCLCGQAASVHKCLAKSISSQNYLADLPRRLRMDFQSLRVFCRRSSSSFHLSQSSLPSTLTKDGLASLIYTPLGPLIPQGEAPCGAVQWQDLRWLVFCLFLTLSSLVSAETVTIATWNLNWFPEGNPTSSEAERTMYMSAAEDALIDLGADILCFE